MTAGPEPDLLATTAAGPAAIRGGALRIGGYIAGVVLSVASAALLFRHLGVADTGRYVTVLALVAIVAGVSDAGLTAIGVRELSVRTGPARDALARNLLGLRIVLTVVGLAAAVAFAGAAGYGATLVLGTLIAGAGLLLQSVQATLGVALMSRLALGWVTVADLLRQAVTTVVIVTLVAAGAGLLAFFGALAAGSFAALVLTVLLVRGDIPLLPSFSYHEWRALVRDVVTYSIAVVAGVLYFRVAMLLVSLIASEREIGLFGASFRILDVLFAIPGLMMIAVFPIFARAAHADRRRLAYGIDRVFRVSALVAGAVLVALLLGAPLAIEVVAGSDFADAIPILRIQSVALAFTFLSGFWGFVLLSLRMHREILAINLVALALVAALVAVLTSLHGPEGAAIGTIGAEAAIALIYPLVLRRSHPELVPSHAVLLPVALAVGVAIAAWLLPVPAGIQALAGLAVYTAAVVALRAVPDEVFAEVRALTTRRERG